MESHCSNIDWSKCIFCQKILPRNKTTCPANSKKHDIGAGYKSLAEAVNGFKDLGQLPCALNVDAWDEGDGIESTCARHKACWHAACRNVLHPNTLEYHRKRSSDVAIAAEPDELHGELSCDASCSSDSKIPRLTRASAPVLSTKQVFGNECFFCGEEGALGTDLRKVMTFDVDERVRSCAQILGDTALLGKLIRGDMIATEAKYHPACLLKLYRRATRVKPVTDNDITESRFESDLTSGGEQSLALAEVIAYLEDCRLSESTPTVFKLSEIGQLYNERLQKHGILLTSRPNTSLLKERLLANVPELTAVNHGRDVYITFRENLKMIQSN